MSELTRRGFSLGEIPENLEEKNDLNAWHQGYPILLKKECLDFLKSHTKNLKQTEKLVTAILEEKDFDAILEKNPYKKRLEPKFQSLGGVFNENDHQEIETVIFDCMDGNKINAEDLWVKVSWLSFNEDDPSLRFRFSFGINLEEDVAADPKRQELSAQLTDAVFPESQIITKNTQLNKKLEEILNKKPNFVERIIYFNAPNGGAYLHHDLERGHAGVVYAQLSGSTFWLALPKNILMEEIADFAKNNPWPLSLTKEMQYELQNLIKNPKKLGEELDLLANDSLIHFINETKEFTQFLIKKGHYRILNAGDALLLPQKDNKMCCWHSVFCLGEEMGEALSFAIR